MHIIQQIILIIDIISQYIKFRLPKSVGFVPLLPTCNFDRLQLPILKGEFYGVFILNYKANDIIGFFKYWDVFQSSPVPEAFCPTPSISLRFPRPTENKILIILT